MHRSHGRVANGQSHGLDYLATAMVSGPAAGKGIGDTNHPDNLIFDIPNNSQKIGPGTAPIEGNKP